MRFLLDESADFPLARFLTALGHDVTAVVRDYERGQLDPAVLAIAHREQRILITNDGDFRPLVLERRLPHAGVVWLRLNDETLTSKIARLEAVLRDHAEAEAAALGAAGHLPKPFDLDDLLALVGRLTGAEPR